MKSSNPTLKKAFSGSLAPDKAGAMSLKGTLDKSFVLLAIVFTGAGLGWLLVRQELAPLIPLLLIAALGGSLLALFTVFNPREAAITAPVYALLEGMFLSCLSLLLDSLVEGVAFQAFGLSGGVFLFMLLVYQQGWVRVNQRFRTVLLLATLAIAAVYLLSFILSLFGQQLPYIHEGGWMGIGFSLLVIGIASLHLLLDFTLIQEGIASGAPKYMEWYAAFSLLVTLVWLYIELMRLLLKLAEAD
ncbi:Bax inhibitor-1/YccA family protein [Cesiribacter andamanensis]|uniref:Putative membrane protein n=1 Tax=Cesiribacter andamanensis AMV16 TaxID=1279009 RepID=M7N262_9BACT|nr:Bax inhibitor-1/YccA family protein [Cesiribacter andamanensis]EMR01286.1 putative membrane protein [Cesiribacter andamanensis AMV16]